MSGTVAETIATVAGQNYAFSFFISDPGSSSGTALRASFGTQVVLDEIDTSFPSWTEEMFDVTAKPAVLY